MAVFAYGVPAGMAGTVSMFGGFTGLLPIGWRVLDIIFLQQLAEQNGGFKILHDSLSGINEERRLQLLLIAFCFGAFFEGAAGFGTPVAVTGGMLIEPGFSPLPASGLSRIANTAPVAFSALGTPVITLGKVHGCDLMEVTATIGRQLPRFSLLLPVWLIWAFAERKAMIEIWPAILVAGLSFAMPQYPVGNFIEPALVDIIAAIVSMLGLILLLRVWQPKKIWPSPSIQGHDISAAEAKPPRAAARHARADLILAWTLWAILTVFVFVLGLPLMKAVLNSRFAPAFPVAGLHNLVTKVPPVVPRPHTEAGVYPLNPLSATGTGILLAANSSGGVMGKMIDAQSIVVASTATRWFDHEGDVLRYAFFHSIALALPGRPVRDDAGLWMALYASSRGLDATVRCPAR